MMAKMTFRIALGLIACTAAAPGLSAQVINGVTCGRSACPRPLELVNETSVTIGLSGQGLSGLTSGVVTDRSGRPIEGVSVVLGEVPRTLRTRSLTTTRAVTLTARGVPGLTGLQLRFRTRLRRTLTAPLELSTAAAVTGLSATPAINSVTCGGTRCLEPLELADGEAVTVTLSGERLGGLISGLVTDDAGRPVDGVTVELLPFRLATRRPARVTARGVPGLTGLQLRFRTRLRRTVTAPVELSTTAAERQVTSPASGEELYSGRTHAVSWTGFQSREVQIDLYRGSLRQITVTATTPNDGSFEWTVPGVMPAADYRLVVRDLSDPDQHAESPAFSIAAPPPSVVITSPADGETWHIGQTYTISWTGVEGPDVQIDLYRGSLSQGTVTAFAPNDGSFEWTVPGVMPAADYRLVVRDHSDPDQHAESPTFSIADAPVPIEITRPVGGETWHIGQTYTISWTGVQGPDVQIDLYRGPSGGNIVTSTANDGSYDWTPEPFRATASNYRVIIRDLSKGMFQSSAEFALEPAVPRVIAPVEGAVIPVNSSLTIEWSDFPSTDNVSIEICRPDQTCVRLLSTSASSGSFDWNANVTPGAGYRIKVTSTSDASVSALSGSFEVRE